MEEKKITLGMFLTKEQFEQCREIFKQCAVAKVHPHSRLVHEVILPNMEEIDKKLGQKNDPNYLAYVIEYVVMMAIREMKDNEGRVPG